jgi:hypothetical protein
MPPPIAVLISHQRLKSKKAEVNKAVGVYAMVRNRKVLPTSCVIAIRWPQRRQNYHCYSLASATAKLVHPDGAISTIFHGLGQGLA